MSYKLAVLVRQTVTEESNGGSLMPSGCKRRVRGENAFARTILPSRLTNRNDSATQPGVKQSLNTETLVENTV